MKDENGGGGVRAGYEGGRPEQRRPVAEAHAVQPLQLDVMRVLGVHVTTLEQAFSAGVMLGTGLGAVLTSVCARVLRGA